MSFFEALFFLYLLFPVINENQFLISYAMKGNISLEKIEELQTELGKFLNSDEIDFEFYEKSKKNHSEFYIRNSLGRLVFFKFDNELLSVSKELENFSCTSVNEDQFSRVKYNSDYKPVEKIVWENKNTVADSKIVSKENWEYSGEYIFSNKEDFKNKKNYEIRYNKDFLPIYVVEYCYIQNSESTEEMPLPEIKTLMKKNFFSYDNQNRLLFDEEIFYDEKKEGKEIYRKKNVYNYTGKSENADFEFYENGNLRFSIKYSNDDDFVETVYFPDGKFMETKFVNGEKIN
ncbi:hypothetical protein [uncultured Treponema sp.]|uniref:hypothetical protein n=1 Tax=uncultured Treponema sp. TaxID=162155 RepID=UPI000E83BDF6|nr:hypothetical protein [uncultured Treponema sp.]HAZ96085.1 hypothetical protein [Treponema sp.]